jgi:IS30 family transposase
MVTVDYRERVGELRRDRAEVARALRTQGMALRAIALRLGCSHVTVLDDLRRGEEGMADG